MQKLPFRSVRLLHMDEYEIEPENPAEEGRDRDNADDAYTGKVAYSMKYKSNAITEAVHTENTDIDTLKLPIAMSQSVSEAQQAQRDTEAQSFLKRTPNNYLLNQIYGLWVFLAPFCITLILTHTVSKTQYGIYGIIQTAINTTVYIVALGLEDAIVTFVPRVSVEHGQAAAGRLIKQLLWVRIAILLGCASIIIFGLPILAWLMNLLPIAGTQSISTNLQNPILLAHTKPIALYVLGSGIANLLQAVCAAQMRMIRVLIIGGLTQLGLVIFGFIVLSFGWGIDGVLWIQASVALLGACGFLIWLSPLFFARAAENKQPLKPVLQVGLSAWLTNLASGALFKQVLITLLTIYVVSEEVANFNLSFQLADAANLLLVAGFAGVGASALAASFVGQNYERLANSWQSLIKVETLLAAPGLVFCLFNAQPIAIALFGNQYASVGPLLAIFVIFNILYRIIGTTIHQSSLYVIGKPQIVVISQWLGLLLIIGLGIILIPRFGPAGALIADGIAKALTGVFMIGFLLRKFPRKYPLGILSFTLRFLLALTIAALPGLLWPPSGLAQLIASGAVFMALCIGTLLVIKPLSREDLEMIAGTKPGLARYIRWFTQK